MQAEQLTKLGNQWNEVSYELGGDDDDASNAEDEDAMEVDSPAKKSKSEVCAKLHHCCILHSVEQVVPLCSLCVPIQLRSACKEASKSEQMLNSTAMNDV
jgi:hypothetical protein